ncbi:hypothetical protein M427DRAFT_55333 [Gonapodya prolifera JEL478]|uniref:Uncharacterized protein n=1 Tax=Gonapodya prolifera (strain JEL478) TaxID=1344416 RepID=A0A139AIZ5_GONPJ|nr:hypothetical protein M427DRAFT_55333 [Gonapodya prolifera JEL478]|eukprot:KXS16689.1 hypothetical protein M427DRAFT_55333 [Gonapodya prolifera JEL478]
MPVVARVLYLAVLAGTAAAQVHTAVVLAGMCKRIEERGISGMTSEKSLARIPEEDVLMPMSVTGSLTPAPGHANGGAHKQILLPSRIVVKAKPHRRAVLIDTSSSSMLLYDQDSPTTAVSESTAIFFEAKKVE